MNELELLRLQARGIPVHVHESPKRGKWVCTSPYCRTLLEEHPLPAPNEHPDSAQAYDQGEF